MERKRKNVTFHLPTDLIEKYKRFAEENTIPSMNAGVKEALEAYSVRIEKDQLRKEMENAAQDPLFMEDVDESMHTFEHSDDESTRESSQW